MNVTRRESSGPGIDPNNNQNRISQGTKITGEVVSSGGFRIDGEFEGNIKSSGKVVIGSSGVVKGTINSMEAEIEGHIKGKLVVEELLSLRAAAHVEGEVFTSKLSVEPGATFNATCDMNGNRNRNLKTLDFEGRKSAEERQKTEGRQQTEKPA